MLHRIMTPYLIFILMIMQIKAEKESNINMTKCDWHHANFDMKNTLGTWYVVAIIPENQFPGNQKVINCYKMELSETDEAGLRWLISRKIESPAPELLRQIKGTIVRQRYHTEHSFDVWSKAVSGVTGCFRQVLSLDTDKTEIGKAISHDAVMQLHYLETDNKDGPFLLQILWGRMISVVIYRRNEGVTQDQLKPVYDFMNKLRGPQRIPRICDKPLKEVLLENKRP